MVLQGTFRILILYDVADSINLDRLNSILRVRSAERLPSFTHPTPEYVRFELPPVVEPLNPIELDTGDQLGAQIKYFDYGVANLELSSPSPTLFSCSKGNDAGRGETEKPERDVPALREVANLAERDALSFRLQW